MAIKGVSHIGICVADLGRSIDFYCAGLGFELLRSYSIAGDPWTRVLEVEPLALESRILRRDGLTIELLLFSEPGHVGDDRRRPMNALGFTHLAVWVDDLDLEARRVVEHGGTVVEASRATFDTDELRARWVYCTDPDGVRIELIEHPQGEAVALSR